MAKIIKIDNEYYFDACDGTEAVKCLVWNEKSKATEAHPEGKPWIKLPKDNVTNRAYFSEDLFNETNVNGEVEVEVKTSAPRVLGATGVKQDIIKYLDEETAAEYTSLVEEAVAAFKEAKGSSRKLKLEEMTADQLKEYIYNLENGIKNVTKTGPKSFIDMFTQEQYDRYNELLALAAENKANRPKAERRPLTDEEKAIRAGKRQAKEISKARALLAALQGSLDEDVEG